MLKTLIMISIEQPGGKKDMGGKAIEKKMGEGFPIFLFGVGRKGG